MSGDSPAPTPHRGNHLFELKDTIIGPPMNSKSMTDKAVQFNPEDFLNEPVRNPRPSQQMIALQELNNPIFQPTALPTVRMPSQRNSVQQEETIYRTEDISSHTESRAKASGSEEVIEVVPDKTDSSSSKNKSEQEDNCMVDCLYYLDQCCECILL